MYLLWIERCKPGGGVNERRGGKELYTRNDGVMGCEVGFAGFASKDFVRVEVDVVREPHGCGDSDFADVVGRSR